MPIEPKRELIMQNLEHVLGEIDGLDPYWTNVTSVSRMATSPPPLPAEDKPGIVICTSASFEAVVTADSGMDNRAMSLIITGILDKHSQDSTRAVNRFMQDISIAILKDPTRGNHATHTGIVCLRETTRPDSGLASFEIVVSIEYEYGYAEQEQPQTLNGL